MKLKILTMVALSLIIIACKRDEKREPEVHYEYLSTEQRNKTPYFNNPAFDTLTFLSNKGDTLVFAKLKTDSFFTMTGGSPFPDHPGIYTYHQTLRNTYQTIKGNGKFEVRHSKNGLAFDRNLSDFITISFNNFNYYINDYFLGVNHIIIIDSIIFDNKKYFQVTRFFNNWTDSISTEAYINKDYGIFRIEDKILLNNWDLK